MIDQDASMAAAISELKKQAYDKYRANTLLLTDVGNSFVGVNNPGLAYDCPR